MARQTKREIMNRVEGSVNAHIVDHNTVEYQDPEGSRVIRLHQTDILRFRADGLIELDSGGWKTVTTKDRMNKFLPPTWRVYSDKGEWYLYKFNPDPDKYSGRWEPFSDGMALDPLTGKIEGAMSPEDVARQAATRKAINRFTKAIRDAESLPEPAGGDCWHCLLFDPEGERRHDECLMQHVEDGYIHGALIVRAMRAAGYKDIGIGLHCGWGGARPVRPFDAPARAVRKLIMRSEGLNS